MLLWVSVTSFTLMEIGILPNAAMLLLLSRVLFLVVTMAYYYHLGRKPKKIWADISRERTAEHRSQMWGRKVLNNFWQGLGGLPVYAPCPRPVDLTYYNPQYSTDKHGVTFQIVQQERETS